MDIKYHFEMLEKYFESHEELSRPFRDYSNESESRYLKIWYVGDDEDKQNLPDFKIRLSNHAPGVVSRVLHIKPDYELGDHWMAHESHWTFAYLEVIKYFDLTPKVRAVQANKRYLNNMQKRKESLEKAKIEFDAEQKRFKRLRDLEKLKHLGSDKVWKNLVKASRSYKHNPNKENTAAWLNSSYKKFISRFVLTYFDFMLIV